MTIILYIDTRRNERRRCLAQSYGSYIPWPRKDCKFF